MSLFAPKILNPVCPGQKKHFVDDAGFLATGTSLDVQFQFVCAL